MEFEFVCFVGLLQAADSLGWMSFSWTGIISICQRAGNQISDCCSLHFEYFCFLKKLKNQLSSSVVSRCGRCQENCPFPTGWFSWIFFFFQGNLLMTFHWFNLDFCWMKCYEWSSTSTSLFIDREQLRYQRPSLTHETVSLFCFTAKGDGEQKPHN